MAEFITAISCRRVIFPPGPSDPMPPPLLHFSSPLSPHTQRFLVSVCPCMHVSLHKALCTNSRHQWSCVKSIILLYLPPLSSVVLGGPKLLSQTGAHVVGTPSVLPTVPGIDPCFSPPSMTLGWASLSLSCMDLGGYPAGYLPRLGRGGLLVHVNTWLVY